MANPSIKFFDKFLPDQPEHTNNFRGENYHAALYELICRSSGIDSPHDSFKLEQTDMFSVEEMASNPISMRFFEFLIQVSGVRRVLEVGAFIGVSTMNFARALPAGGEVVSIEKFDHFAAIARKNFEANGLSGRIRLIEGDAFEVIESLPEDEKFDLIFIDGNKERYKDYVEKTEHLLSDRGIMVVDDCFFHGDVANQTPIDEKGVGTRAFMDHAATRDDYLRIALPLANGIFLMVRKQ